MAKAALSALLFLVLSMLAAPALGLEITPLNENVVAVQLTSRGETREAALTKARQEAVLASAGRVLIDDQLLRADTLLVAYLEKYAARFVRTVEVLDDRFTGGESVMTCRVFVNNALLSSDLEEKRFLFEPAYKPMLTVFLQEEIDGRQLEEQVGRLQLENAFGLAGMKIYKDGMDTPPSTVSVADDPALLTQAIEAAERRTIEVIVSGTAVTRLREERKVYYDIYYFYDCEMDIKVVRVDTGEVLFEASATGTASDKDRAGSIQTAIERASTDVVTQVVPAFRRLWPVLVQGGAEYELLLTGTDEELNRIISQHLERTSRGTKVMLRKAFDRSAILVISTQATREDIVEQIQSSPFPTLTIISEIGSNKFEVQVSG